MNETFLTRLTRPMLSQETGAEYRFLFPCFQRSGEISLSAPPLLLPPGCAPGEDLPGDCFFLLRLDGVERLGPALPAVPTEVVIASPAVQSWLISTLNLLEEMQQTPSGAAASLRFLLVETLTAVLTRKFWAQEIVRPGSRAAPSILVEETRRYIEDHASENLSLVDIAGQLFITPSYLSRIFHRFTGMTFSHYVQEIRLEKARGLLIQTGLSITEIAIRTGFGTSSHLGSIFRRAYGISPNAYRAQINKTRYLRRE